LLRGGLPVAEVTFRTAAAGRAIEVIRASAPDMLVGAGTVASPAQVDEAISAGAAFVVTPGFNRRVVEACLEKRIPVIPGVNAPGFIEMALEYGLETLKFFPAGPSGGVAFLKSLAGPYPHVRFMPTGGVTLANLPDYLALPNVIACGGSWMVEGALIDGGRFDEIASLAAAAVAVAAQVRR
jgi:2-dehydro-3-deoxyphosphogluconate aldolase / (4S)-4-hydroxy-2-oxoglutarate aldolase